MRKILQSIAVTIGIIGIAGVAVPPSPVMAADPKTACNDYILTFPAWYNNVTTKDGDDCKIELSQDQDGKQIQTTIVKIILNIVDILMQLVAYSSIAFLIIGGFRYLTSAGAPDRMTAAKKTIANAIFGLIIGMLAVAIVNLVGASL